MIIEDGPRQYDDRRSIERAQDYLQRDLDMLGHPVSKMRGLARGSAARNLAIWTNQGISVKIAQDTGG
jgi:hypothetical protein